MRREIIATALVGLAMTGAAHAQGNGAHPVRVRGNPATWFNHSDYPAAALAVGDQGRVKIALAVNAGGAATSCTVLESSGSALLDDGTCDVAIKNAQFVAATDSTGVPIASVYVMPPVSWALGNTADGPGKPLRLSEAPAVFEFSRTIVDVDSEGKVLRCRPYQAGSKAPLCETLKKGQPITGPITKDGKSVSGSVTITQTMSIMPF